MAVFARTHFFWFVLIVLFFGAQFFVKRDLVSGVPPRIQALKVDGVSFDSQNLKGRTALIYFWASWCGICDAMDSTIDLLNREYSVMTIAMQSGDGQEVAAHLRKNGLSFPVIADEDGAISSRYGLQAVPAFFVLKPSGEVAFSGMGYTTRWGIEVRLWLAEKGWL